MGLPHYGDNHPMLREQLGDETVDLGYLSAPFNSDASSNALLKGKRGAASRIKALDDPWQWVSAVAAAFPASA